MVINQSRQYILEIARDLRLIPRQSTHALAEYAENLCGYPEGAPAFYEADGKSAPARPGPDKNRLEVKGYGRIFE